MKDFLNNILKNKMYLTLTILQVLAIGFILFGYFWSIFFLIGIIFEGVFFIVLGVMYLIKNSKEKEKQAVLENLPFEKNEIEGLQKKTKRTMKYNKLTGVIYILLGLVLVSFYLF